MLIETSFCLTVSYLHMDKVTLVIIMILFLSVCKTKTNTNSDNLIIKDSSNTNSDDSITYSLRPLSAFMKDNIKAQRIHDTLLTYTEIKKILEGNSDTTFDVNLYVFGGVEEKDKSGRVIRTTFSNEDLTVCLWTINRKTLKTIRHGNFHFNLNTMDFYVIEPTGVEGQMTIDTWCKKQHIKK